MSELDVMVAPKRKGRSMDSLGRRVSTGLRWGMRYAVVFSLMAVVATFVKGPAVLVPYRLTIGGIVALYLAMGLIGGVVFGVLMPLGRSLWGSVLLGLLVAIPVAFLVAVFVVPEGGYRRGEFLWCWISVSLLGPVCGAGFWVQVTRTR
jgi:hypothetical protein